MSRSRDTACLLAVGLLLSGSALGKKRDQTPPSLLGPALEELCPTLPPTGYRLWRGDASGAEAGEAIRLARQDAQSKAVASACEGLSTFQCAAIKRNIRDWQQGWWDAKTGAACASVALRADWLDLLDKQTAEFDQHLRQMLDHAVTLSPDKTLRLEPPVWESGCVAGQVGEALSVEVRQRLGAYPDLRLIEGDTAASSLRFRLAPSPGGVALSASLGLPDKVGMLPLPGFDFPLDLFQVKPSEVGRCRSDSALGLQDGEIPGADGRRAWITLPSSTGVWCEGSRMEPFLAVNRPSRVRVFDVTVEGEAYLIWPPPGVPDLVQSAVSLGQMDLISLPEVGDERLLAVAVPAGGSLGALEGWESYCKVPGLLGPDRYPEGAAVGSVTFSVTPALQGACPAAPAAQAIKEQLPEFPVCASR
ncbi:MAG: hypothetical protein JXX28_05335 [Deltaproteobacteria bacterium]|nr:hypothetical protein [Deltaproteobacteria bacterium]